MNEYRVNLDVYNGPLDLLLYLIRRDEVDIYDIPISGILEQYLKYVEMLQQVDPNLAGEFLVMAAALMEIKTRLLLPIAPAEDGATDGGAGLDPRAELVRQLLQYKAFKDAAQDLQTAASLRAMKFERRPAVPDAEAGEYDIEDVQVWDLLDAFSKVMAAIGQQSREHQVIYDDTPVEMHASDIMDRLHRDGPLSFRQIFEGRTNRSEIVGLFLALLELVRQRKIMAVQDANFGEIAIQPRPDMMEERPADFADRVENEAAAEVAVPAAAEAPQERAAQGQYLSETPGDDALEDGPFEENDDEHPGETAESGD